MYVLYVCIYVFIYLVIHLFIHSLLEFSCAKNSIFSILYLLHILFQYPPFCSPIFCCCAFIVCCCVWFLCLSLDHFEHLHQTLNSNPEYMQWTFNNKILNANMLAVICMPAVMIMCVCICTFSVLLCSTVKSQASPLSRSWNRLQKHAFQPDMSWHNLRHKRAKSFDIIDIKPGTKGLEAARVWDLSIMTEETFDWK